MTENPRIEAQKKLSSALKNPGYFSILLMGDNGTGKSYMLNTILENDEKGKKIAYYYPFEIGDNEEEMKVIFENDIIVIKGIEELSETQQKILFKALTTIDGKIGIGDKKGLKRIVFTSSFEVEQLSEGANRLMVRFWDRISQLVIKVPSFKDYSSNILEDFESVWNKMQFKEYPKLPKDVDFKEWLIENCGSFAGNFRDLDNIAILWHQYRIIEYNNNNNNSQNFKSDIEKRIFKKVRNDFENFTHFPTQKSDGSNVFEIQKGKTWEQIERGFRSFVKSWAKREYKTIKEATKELNMPSRKMDKW